MAKGIYDLGTNLGYIYLVAPDGTTILDSLLNTPENARRARVRALEGSAVALNRKPNGTITVTGVTGVGTITGITINGNPQIDPTAPIAFTGATTTTALAALIVTAINSYDDPATANDYNATSTGAVVTVIGDETTGASDNGGAIVVTISANATYTSVAINNGSDATELYDQVYGYRLFLDADYDASGCAGSGSASPSVLGNAVEISDYIIPRSLNSAIPVETITLASDTLTVTRSSVDTLVFVETEALAGTDNLFTINAAGFADGDKITLRGNNSGRVTTVTDATGNIELQGNVNFVTAGLETALTLQLRNATWYEVSRTTQALGVTADYRTAGFGQFGIETYNTAVHATTGTVTFDGGTDSKWQNLTGAVALAGNTAYALGTGVNGDEFILTHNASVTRGAFTLTIFGVALSADQALNSGLIFHAKYMGGSWRVAMYPNFDRGIAYPFVLATEAYKDLSVTVAKVEATLSTETITRRVSFESGEECDNQVKMGYPGTVVEVYFTVDKVIAGTDNGTITPKNNAGTAMTAGLITVTAASALDTGFTSTPTGNNTFIAGDVLNFTTAKTTKGGFGTLSIKVTKS